MSNEAAAPAPASPTAPQPPGTTGFDDAAAIQSRIVVRPVAEQEFLRVNVSDVRLRLRELTTAIETGIKDREAWKAPAGLAIGLLSSLITVAATGDAFRLLWSRETWMGVFGLALLLSVVWLVRGIWNAVAPRRDAKTIEDVIRDLGGNVPPL